jgi:hypothetical protein
VAHIRVTCVSYVYLLVFSRRTTKLSKREMKLLNLLLMLTTLAFLATRTNAAHLSPYSTLTFVEPQTSLNRNFSIVSAWSDSAFEVALTSTLEDGSENKVVLRKSTQFFSFLTTEVTLEGTGPWTVSAYV